MTKNQARAPMTIPNCIKYGFCVFPVKSQNNQKHKPNGITYTKGIRIHQPDRIIIL